MPRVAIVEGDSVFVVNEDNTVTQRKVKIAAYTRDGAIITGGLTDGERVAVSRVTVPDGGEVRPLDAATPSAADQTTEENVAAANADLSAATSTEGTPQ